MASPPRLRAKRKPRLLDGRAVAAFVEACGSGGAAVARGGSPGGLLARLFEVARGISGGVRGGAAARLAADRARILCAGGDGAARAIRKIVGRFFLAWIGAYGW